MTQIVKSTSFGYKIYHIAIAAILCLLLSSFFSKAQEIRFFSYQNIGNNIYYFQDKQASLSLEAVQQLNDTAFKKGKQAILNLGNTTSAWWIKLRYESPAHLPLYLIFDAPNTEYIAAYTTDSTGKPVRLETGSLAQKSANVVISNNFMLTLPVSKQKEYKTIYLRLKTNNILLVPIKLATSKNIMTEQAVRVDIEYIYIGLLIGLLLFNLFLFMSIKDVTYLYYVLYVFTLSSYILLYIRGYSFIFGDDFRIIFNKYPHAFMGLSLVALLMFSRKFLHLEANAPKLKKPFYILGCVGIVLFLTSILGFKNISSTITQLAAFVTALVVWIAGIVAYRNGHKPAKYFIIAWFFIWVSSAIVTMSLGGLIIQNEFTIQLVPLSTIIELLLLSFALGDRYKLIMQTEQKLRDENLVLIKTQNQRLEESVYERTLQLSSTITELEDSNAVKNKLFSIIAHDLRSPLSSLMGILSLNDMQALTPDELRMLLAENKKTIDSINNTLNNLLHWAQGQMNGMVMQVSSFSLKLLLDELMLLYLPLIKKKNIQVELNLDYPDLVVADQNQINLVVRNLIDNAIKFTPLGGQIVISIQLVNTEVLFSIQNEVQNELEIKMDNLQGKKITASTSGTQNERGVGLGLQLCNEYVENNGSTLETSLSGNMLVFSFVLPQGN